MLYYNTILIHNITWIDYYVTVNEVAHQLDNHSNIMPHIIAISVNFRIFISYINI